MEDISRELEKEIAQSKPKPYKKDREKRILIVDDFGQMKSGEYLKHLVRILSVLTVVCVVVAAIFFKLYSDVSKDSSIIKDRLILADKNIETLKKEKEVLMARLVILGKEPFLEKESINDKKAPQKNEVIANAKDKKLMTGKMQKIATITSNIKKKAPALQESVTKEKTTANSSELNTVRDVIKETSQTQEKVEDNVQTSSLETNMVSIEKFTVTNDRVNGDLLVRFDIRNISKESGDVSGRIFTVLKPDNKPQDQWQVVPAAPLKAGIPSEFKKGQYFSIAHFKPINFRIKNSAAPDFFQKASIYIFNSQGDIIFEKLIKITEADEAQ